MTNEQEVDFWKTIESLNNLELLPNLVVIGSWAEYLYMEKLGFVHDNVRDGVSTFYKKDSLEIEFLTRILGAGDHISCYIEPIGIKADCNIQSSLHR